MTRQPTKKVATVWALTIDHSVNAEFADVFNRFGCHGDELVVLVVAQHLHKRQCFGHIGDSTTFSAA